MKIIFLDIDGVLNHHKCRWCFDHVSRKSFFVEEGDEFTGFLGMDPERVKIVLDIVEKTGAKIVLSSTWRKHNDWLETMVANGFNSDLFVGRTIHDWEMIRGQEIQAWIDEHQDLKKFAIIDDDSDMLPSQFDSFFQTSFATGITPEIAEKIINHLNA